MPTAKDKGGSTSHRYRPASEYDDATLSQKRQYWRTKKREQRARLTERRGKATQGGQGGKLRHLHSPVAVNPTLSGSFAAFSSPLQSNEDSYKMVNVSPALQSGNTTEGSSLKANENLKWLHAIKLDKVSPLLPASCSNSAKAARGNTAVVKRLPAGAAVSRAVTSPTSSGTQQSTCSSVPHLRVTRTTNGSSAETTQPHVSIHKTQVSVCIQPKLLPTNVTTATILMSPACVPVSAKTEARTVKTTPQSGAKSALVTQQRTVQGVSDSLSPQELEEERAAKRREQWRMKKREQRAKLATRLTKARERVQNTETTLQRQAAQKTGLTGLQHLPSQSFLRGVSQKQCPAQVKTSFTAVKKENDRLQSGAQSFVTVNLQADGIKVQNSHGNRMTQTALMQDGHSVRKPVELQRKIPSYVHLSNVSRGIVRCKTPRQRFIEAQKNFMNQRNMRCKSPLLTSVYGSRNLPQIHPNDTPEQIIAKRREYWRIKKREQRAKLTMETKARLKEKDSLTRRVKRYHKILEEMRRARALAQSTGSTLTHASETIGGFIKEDGTVTNNIPHISADHTAAHKSVEECCVVPNNVPIVRPNNKRRGISAINVMQTSPYLRPAQVKVSFPLAGQSLTKSSRLLSIRPRTHLESTNLHRFPIQTTSQLTLTDPQTPHNAVSGGPKAAANMGSCVMKMAVSSNVPSPSALSLDPNLTEEERMAKKREYWRIKKREQRAARAARLKQGVLHARANATLQRRRAQKNIAVTIVPPARRLINHAGNAPPIPKTVPVRPHANEIKQEGESTLGCDLHSQPEQAICPHIKAPTSPPPPPPPAPQLEPDPALPVDTQATTLLAVASMKKLLEESLSSVTECSGEQTAVKLELKEEVSEPEVKPNVAHSEEPPGDADLMQAIKSFQPDTLSQAASPNPYLKDSPPSSPTQSPPPTSSEVVTCEHSSQTPSNFILNPSMKTSPPRRTQRLRCIKVDPQSCCPPETQPLHHLPVDQLQHCERVQEECQSSDSPSARGYVSVGKERTGMMSLQKKREYWKLMKRQQRARLRARQNRQGEGSSRLSQRNMQSPGLHILNPAKGVNPRARPALQAKPSITSLAAVNRIPSVLLISPLTRSTDQSTDTLQVKLPVASVSCSPRPSHIMPSYQGAHRNPQIAVSGSGKWTSRSPDLDPAPSLPTLTPPENPLSRINLQPIEPPLTPNSTLSPIKIPCNQLQSPTLTVQSPTKVALTTMAPPKPIPGEPEEDFLRRKREYWRIKKKEQRARKAIRDKGVSPRRGSHSLRPILPAQDPKTQECGQWASSSEESEHLLSTSEDTDPGSFSFPSYTAPVEDETELLLADYENNTSEEGPVPEATWRNSYLMDYDPLNQLLVCMVCGELQYSHSLEGVRAHIDEAHPETLTLEPTEQLQILEAWDEQVSQRERFFTSQLQQHGGAMAEANRD